MGYVNRIDLTQNRVKWQSCEKSNELLGLRISRLADELLAFQGYCPMDLVIAYTVQFLPLTKFEHYSESLICQTAQ
jgi:hypothetical protein